MEPAMRGITEARDDHRGARRFMTRSGVALALVGAIAACQPDGPTSARVVVQSASLAKGGGSGGGSGGAAPTVGSVAPTSTVQDTTIDVNVFGSGFTSGAVATWSLGGDTTKVHVKSTRFVSSSQLVARIVVPVTAPVASYDVVVMLIGGKKGVGAELFAVLLGDPKATFYFPLTDAGLALKSDHLYVDGTFALYAQGLCGASAKIFATAEASNSGDAVMQTNNPTYSDRRCAAYPRTMTLAYSDGVSETIPIFMNVRQIQSTTSVIPLGATVKRAFAVNPTQKTRCDVLAWMNTRQGVTIDADSVWVTRTAADTWHVQTQAAPNDRAYCTATGQSYHMPLDFTIKSSRPLPLF
jgi:hypothetical protein